MTPPSTAAPTRTRVRPLPSDTGPRALAAAHGAADAPAVVRTDVEGVPLRCCLRNSRPGEPVALVSVTLPGPGGPYAEIGPVYVHPEACGGPEHDGYPEDWRRKVQVFRAYDARGWILGGEVVEPGDGQEEVAARMLADPAVAFLHTRNVLQGCYMAMIERA